MDSIVNSPTLVILGFIVLNPTFNNISVISWPQHWGPQTGRRQTKQKTRTTQITKKMSNTDT